MRVFVSLNSDKALNQRDVIPKQLFLCRLLVQLYCCIEVFLLVLDLPTDVKKSASDFLVIIPCALKRLDNLAEMIHILQASCAHL